MPGWCRGYSGPHDAGHYNSQPGETGFFRSQYGNWESDYGRFFLDWYSNQLIQHADRIVGTAAEVLGKRGPCRAASFVEVLAAAAPSTSSPNPQLRNAVYVHPDRRPDVIFHAGACCSRAPPPPPPPPFLLAL